MTDETNQSTAVEPAAAAPTETPVSFDIADYDTAVTAEEGAVMEVRHPGTGEVLLHGDDRPFTITLRGVDSEKLESVAMGQQDRRTGAQMRTRVPTPGAVIRRDNIELLVAATIKWDLILNKEVPKSEAKNFRAAYTKYKWLYDQVDAFVGARGNFTKTG